MKKLMGHFAKGVIFIVPIAVTLYILYLIFAAIDRIIHRIPGLHDSAWWVTFLGIVVALVLITLIGWLTSLFITRPLFTLVERTLGRLPLIKLLYSSLKDLIGAFVGDKKKFDKPVLVKVFPGSDVKVMGFVTRESLEFAGLKDEVAVYLPQSYNFAGFLIIVPRERIVPLSMDSSDLMKFIVSGGVAGPHSPHENP